MSNRPRLRFLYFAVVLLLLAIPVMADVTITGTVLFSSLDGSALDDDHTVNGIFTVNGNLTVTGTINCNDVDKGSSACPMQFVVTGNTTLAPGSQISAENRDKDGNGGDISFVVGGNMDIQGTSGATPGALISSSKTNGGVVFHAGNITINTGGTLTDGAGSIVSAASVDGTAGAISITSGAQSSIGGYILSGPSRTITGTIYTSFIMSGTGSTLGGNINIKALTSSEPGVLVSSSAIVASQSGDVGSGGTVTLEGCNVQVNGLVASVGKKNPGEHVIVRSGTSITVDGSNLGGAGIHLGRIRADANAEDASTNTIELYAKDSVNVIGPASGMYAVSSNPGAKGGAGTISVIATTGTISASGLAYSASGLQKDETGGTIGLSAKGNVTLPGTSITAAGGTTGSSRAGGHINVRSYSGSVSWTAGVGDVRPVGSTSGVPAAQQGTISLTYCTTLATTGTSFPTNGSPVGVFPTTAQTCSPAAPTLPAGNTLPTCNTPPVANNDNYTVAEGGTLNVPAPGVLANDTDAEANPITAILVTGPAHASSFNLNSDGSFTYVHDGSETTSDSFTYKANDGASDSNVATVHITITPVNDAPVANDDSATVAEGGTINMAAPGVLANDTDPDGPSLTVVLVSGPSHASAFSLNADGSYVYVHDGSETTSDSFTYKASDGSLFSNVATVHITITPVNDAPVANNDTYTVAEGGTLNIAAPGVLGNDTDADGPSLHTVLVSGPAHASSFTLNADGSFSYVHDGSETISDSFTYKANDGSLDSNVATMNITVTPVNDAPVASNDAYSVNEGGTLTVAAPGVLGNDTDADSPSIGAVLVSGPAHATSFALNPDGSFSYVHDGSETTTDSFTYKANDGSLDSNVATVTITINPVNDAPVAVNDSYSVNEGGTLSVSAPGVLGNDTDSDSPVITAVLVSGPLHASSFTLNPDGSFSYVHDGGESLSDSFTYKANDGSLDSNVATVNITINPVNDAPVAVNDAYAVNEGGTLSVTAPGVLGNDTDSDSPVITAVLVSSPTHAASFSLNADGSFNYVHDGSETTSDTFTYKANDGSLDSNVATVTITVTSVNDAPVITAGGTLNYTEGNPATVIDNTITITDSDSANLTGATVQISSNYVNGQDILAFAPIGPITGSFNAATGTLTLTGTDTVANYQAALRTVTYSNTSNNPSTAPRTVSWQVNDGAGVNNLSNVATSTITVTSVNSAPVLANGSTLNYTENDPATVINSVITASDVDSTNFVGATVTISGGYVSGQDVLSFTNAFGITGSFNAGTGTLTLSGSATVANYQAALRSVKYTNTSDDPSTGARTISFQVDDGGATSNLSNVVTSTINITAVNDAPTAFAFAGLPAQAGIPITYPAGKLGGSDVEAGTTVTVDTTPINLVNVASVTLNANGSFTFTPAITAAGGTASFQYRVSDNGNPAPGVNSSYVTVSFSVAGPAIYFVKSAAVGTGNCTLGNECTLVTAITNIGASANTNIFIEDANTHTLGPITLNSGGSLIGQGVTAASFDTLFGIGTPSQGVLAPRPLVNQARPTVATNVTLNNNSQARGFNITVTSGDALIASSRTGLVVTDMDVATSTSNPAQAAVHFTSSSGSLLSFGNITASAGGAGVNFNASTSTSTVTFTSISTTTGTALTTTSSGSTNFTFGTVTSTTGQAVSATTGSGAFVFTKINAGTVGSGPSKAIVVNGLTGSFTVNGTGGLCDATHISGSDCTGGTIQSVSARGAEFISSNNVTLKNMYFKSNSTVVAGGCMANIATGANTSCNGPVFLQTVNGATLNTLFIDGSSQMGVVANGVSAFNMTGSEVRNVGSLTGVEQSALDLQNLSGTSTISGSHIHDNDFGHNVFITNNTGTATVNFTNNTVDNVTVANPAHSDGFQAQAYSSANLTVTVSNTGGTCTFNKLFGNGVMIGANNSSTVNGTLSNCTVTKTTGVFLQGSGTSNMSGTVTGNTISNKVSTDWVSAGSGSNGITIAKSSGASSATFTGNVTNNTINKANCGGGCTGVAAGSFGNGTTTMTINGNLIQHVDSEGINFTAGQASGTSNNVLTIQGNTITNPDSSFNYPIDVTNGTSSGDHACIAMNIGDMSVGHTVAANRNTITNGSTGFQWVNIGGAPSIGPIGNYAAGITGTFKLFNLTGGTDDTAAQNWIVASNPGTSSDAYNGGVPWVSGTSCP
jgi:VCBS repeat-containing protein